VIARIVAGMSLLVVQLGASAVHAGVPEQVARLAADEAARVLGRQAERSAVTTLSQRIARLAAEHGAETLVAVRQAGPEAVEALERASRQGGLVSHLLAAHGSEALLIVREPALLELVARHGDDAAVALVRHPGLAHSVIEATGAPGARALTGLSAQNGRRLAMLVEDGALIRLGHQEELLSAIERHGDRAMEFLWRHKGALAVATLLVTFLKDPEPFLSGARELGGGMTHAVAQPVLGVANDVGQVVMKPLTVAAIGALVVLTGIGGYRVHRMIARARR
jgi:hypothetical protein